MPEVAVAAGFPRPILHGLCTFAIAARGMIDAVVEGDESRLEEISVRFSSPVFPGETLRTEYWKLGAGELAIRTRVIERDVVVLNGGRIKFADR